MTAGYRFFMPPQLAGWCCLGNIIYLCMENLSHEYLKNQLCLLVSCLSVYKLGVDGSFNFAHRGYCGWLGFKCSCQLFLTASDLYSGAGTSIFIAKLDTFHPLDIVAIL